jgi:cytochrome c-type biogenesis protein CcmE
MKSKYIFGGIIIVVFLGLMGYLLTQTNISYENDFTQVMNSKTTIKATGAWVKEKHYSVDKQKNLLTFYLRDDEGNEMKVVYKGTIPNNFESATTMVVTGKYHDGYFEANDILTKCPSKYEATYEESENS